MLDAERLLRYDRTTTQPNDDRLVLREGESAPAKLSVWEMTPKADLSKGPMGRWDEPRTLEVVDPQLDQEQVQQVSEQLGQILETEL